MSAAEVSQSQDFISSAPSGEPKSIVTQVNDLVLWRNLMKSGIVFAVGNLFFFLVIFRGYTVLSLTCYLILALTGASFLYTNGRIALAAFQQRPLPAKTVSNTKFVDEQSAVAQAPHLARQINGALNWLSDIFFCVDNQKTLQFVGVFLSLALLSKIFSMTVLTYLVFITAFSWPTIYRMKKNEIDHFYNLGMQQVSQISQLVISKIPVPAFLQTAGVKKD